MSSNWEEWYRLRSGVHQMMMRPKEVAAYIHLVDDVARDFAQRLDDVRDDQNRVSDLSMEVSKWNLECWWRRHLFVTDYSCIHLRLRLCFCVCLLLLSLLLLL